MDGTRRCLHSRRRAAGFRVGGRAQGKHDPARCRKCFDVSDGQIERLGETVVVEKTVG